MALSKFRKTLHLMWFFQSKYLAIASTSFFLLFLSFNITIFFNRYEYWIRTYQFVTCMVFWGSVVSIVLYWNRDQTEKMSKDKMSHAQLISGPILVMTIFMG